MLETHLAKSLNTAVQNTHRKHNGPVKNNAD